MLNLDKPVKCEKDLQDIDLYSAASAPACAKYLLPCRQS